MNFPATAAGNLALANELVNHLRTCLVNTDARTPWSKQNFSALQSFSVECGAASYSGPEKNQFLWDYVAHGHDGILIAAESEFQDRTGDIHHDFEKLLYVKSPVKLMMTRVKSEAQAHEQSNDLRIFMDQCCQKYSPGEVFVLYCVWWAEEGGSNRDFAFVLQIPGEPLYSSSAGAQFKRL